MTQSKFVEDVLHLAVDLDFDGLIRWRRDKQGQLIPFILCSDLFYWGVADLEDITPDNVGELKQAHDDLGAINPDEFWGYYAGDLFCARIREMRPQGAAYSSYSKDIWPLFDACGPEREAGYGNPYKPGEYDPNRKSRDYA